MFLSTFFLLLLERISWHCKLVKCPWSNFLFIYDTLKLTCYITLHAVAASFYFGGSLGDENRAALTGNIGCLNGRLHIGANGVSWPPWKNGWKIKKQKHAKKSSFLCLCYILRAIRAGRCRERRYADHIFIQIYFIMRHFVVIFSLPQAARGHPLTKILRTFLAI